MTHDEKLLWMTKWAAKHGATLTLSGECGFGRECVGLLVGESYPDYEWHDAKFNRSDDNGDVWVPADAYHKHPCVAVLGHGENAEAQLYEWLKWFDDNGFVIEQGDAPKDEWENLGVVGLMLGKNRYQRMVRATSP